MKLPAALTPWAKHLQIFPEEISLVLGNYVRKISPFIKPIISSDAEANGEPNGYDGVNRRGIYERLLISELALADDFSEEFVRRAIMGEHLFLNLAKAAPSSERISVALFDAGALQLGSPRIAHLAALILLARRAEIAEAKFYWGVLQNENQLILSDDTETSVKMLLESRTPREISAADLTAWRERLNEIDRFADVWLIGSQNLSAIEEAEGFSKLCIEESSEPKRHELELKIKGVSGIEKKTVLELPPPNICTRLLRNPFEVAPPVNANTGRFGEQISSFFFDATGTKLFAKLSSDNILVFTVANERAVGNSSPVIYQSNGLKQIAAAGRLNKAIALVAEIDEQTVRLNYRKHKFATKEGLYKTDDAHFHFPESGKLLQIFAVSPRYSSAHQAAILDKKGNLFRFAENRFADANQVVGFFQLLATRVLAVAKTDKEFMYIGCQDDSEYHSLFKISNKVEQKPLAHIRLNKAFFGRGERGEKSLAFLDDAGNWSIFNPNGEYIAMPPAAGEYVGVYCDLRFAPSAGLFELSKNRRTLEFVWNYTRRKHIFETEQEIEEIEFCSRSPLLAYKTASELVIFSLTHKTAVGRYSI